MAASGRVHIHDARDTEGDPPGLLTRGLLGRLEILLAAVWALALSLHRRFRRRWIENVDANCDGIRWTSSHSACN